MAASGKAQQIGKTFLPRRALTVQKTQSGGGDDDSGRCYSSSAYNKINVGRQRVGVVVV